MLPAAASGPSSRAAAGSRQTRSAAPTTATADPVACSRSSAVPECGEPTANHHHESVCSGSQPSRSATLTSPGPGCPAPPSARAPPSPNSSQDDTAHDTAASARPPQRRPAAVLVLLRSERATARPTHT
jgi:hypothetical protein